MCDCVSSSSCSDLKTRIEKEGSKRELLGSQEQLSNSLCICCLQPFKFLVNSKRQCLDCSMFSCKACSRYNKKEHGWVCDNCRMTRSVQPCPLLPAPRYCCPAHVTTHYWHPYPSPHIGLASVLLSCPFHSSL